MSRPVVRALIVAPALICLVAAAAFEPQSGQQRQPPFRSSADLVQVDVVVVDKDGNPIRGLTQADFALFDRKKPQTIAAFEEVSHERPAVSAPALPPTLRMDVANNQTIQANRLIVMVVDDLHIYHGRTETAKDLARQIVLQLGPQASMAVLFTSGEKSTQVTADRSVLLTAVETLKGRQSVRRPHQAIDSQRAAGRDPEASMEAMLKVTQAAQDAKLQDFFDNITKDKTLQDASRMLGSDDARRKAFVMVSEGIAKDLTGIFDNETTPCEARCSTCPCYHDNALREMMESMRRSNVTTYNIDPRGHVSSQQLALESFPGPPGGGEDSIFRWDNPIRQAQHGLRVMAAASGGFAITDTDDLMSGLRHIIEDLDHYYLLGFYPTDTGGKRYRPIDVRVPEHPEWTLRFRRGYERGKPPAPPKNTSPLVALSASVMPKTDLPLRLTAIAFPGSGNTARVALALEVTAPVRDLEESDARVRDDLKYEVLVVDENKKKVRSVTGLAGRVTLSPKASGGVRPDHVSYQVGDSVELTPGRYQLRVSAMSGKLDKGGSVYLGIDVPDFRSEPLVLSGLVVGYADGAHVPVAPPTSAPGAARGRVAGPSARFAPPPVPVRPALPFPPSLDREFTPADTLRLYFEVIASDANAPRRYFD